METKENDRREEENEKKLKIDLLKNGERNN